MAKIPPIAYQSRRSMFLPKRGHFQRGLSGWKREFRLNVFGLLQCPGDAGSGNLVCLSQLSQTQPAAPVTEQRGSIDLDGLPTQHTAFEPGTPEAGADPFNY